MTLGVSGLTLGLESPPDLSPRGAWGAEPNTLGIPGVTPRAGTVDEAACRPGS
jgi:hypothetical protein